MERKTSKIIEALKNSPLKLADAAKIAGPNQLRMLCDRGCVERYSDENPDYKHARRGQQPICLWVKLGSIEYIEPTMGSPKISGGKGIERAIQVLERAGYKVFKE